LSNIPITPASNTSTSGNLPDVTSPDNSAPADHDVNMNGTVNTLPDNDVASFYASVPVSDLLRPDESKNALRNRLTFYLTTRYPSQFRNVLFSRIGGDDTNIFVIRFKGSSEYDALLTDSHVDLKINESCDAPIFHAFDPTAVKVDELSRAVIATDIPFFLQEKELRAAFGRYGSIVKFKLSTPHSSLFQKAVITYASVDQARGLTDTNWCVWCRCQCIRVIPASFTKEQHDSRSEFTAVLRNIPMGIDAIDLGHVFDDTNAKAIGLPRHPRSYTNKPWAYFNFQSEQHRNNAMEMSFSLKGRELFWHTMDDVKLFCPRCSDPTHRAKDCPAFNSRGREPIKKSLQQTYRRFKPAGVSLPKDSSRGRNVSNSSRSRSRSRNKDSSSNKTPHKKNVTYADVAKESSNSGSSGNSLDSSIHSPNNRTSNNRNNNNKINNKNKGKERDPQYTPSFIQNNPIVSDHSPPSPPIITKEQFDQVAAVVANAADQLKIIEQNYHALLQRFTLMDSRITNIENYLSGRASSPQSAFSSPVIIPTSQASSPSSPPQGIPSNLSPHAPAFTVPTGPNSFLNPTPNPYASVHSSTLPPQSSPDAEAFRNDLAAMGSQISGLTSTIKDATSFIQDAKNGPFKGSQ